MLVKQWDLRAIRLCKLHNAKVLIDCVDNALCSSSMDSLRTLGVDGVIVQNKVHAISLSNRGIRSFVQYHPHGNVRLLTGKTPKRQLTPIRQLKNVGFVYSDEKNKPRADQLEALCRAARRLNATFWLVKTQKVRDPIVVNHFKCFKDSLSIPLPSTEQQLKNNFTCPINCVVGRPSLRTTTKVHDSTGQKYLYESPSIKSLAELIDVGILWPPRRKRESVFAVMNRPPTRMHFWWALGIPVIGYPLTSYLESAARACYPPELLNVTTEFGVYAALSSIHAVSSRRCLRDIVISQCAIVSSPQFAAVELLSIICRILGRNSTKREASSVLDSCLNGEWRHSKGSRLVRALT